MSKKDNSPAISFFSFQDIITSVTGIMFLVVIMILLLLFQSTPAAPSKAEETPSENADAQAIRAQIEAAREKINQLTQKRDDIDRQIAEIQKLPSEKIEETIRKLTDEIAELNAQKDRLNEQMIRDRETISELRVDAADLRKKRVDMEKVVKETEQKVSENDEEIKDLQKKYKIASQTVKFSIPQSDGRLPFLVECGVDGIQVMDWTNGKLIDLRRPGKNDDVKKYAFLNWLKGQNVSDKVFTLVLKPSTLNYSTHLVSEMKKMGASRGVEFLPDDNLTLTTAFAAQAEGDKK